MEKHHFFRFRISIWLACIAWMLSSCVKDPDMSFSARDVVFDAYPTENITVELLSNVSWTATVSPFVNWLTITPTQGKGNITIVLNAIENQEYKERETFIVILGDGVGKDSIRVVQTAAIDIAEVIEDEAFRKFCLNNFDNSPKDGKISLKEAKNAEQRMVIRGLNISSLVGIEYFVNIPELDCSDNQLKTIDLSKNKSLRKLNCSNNPITQIDVSELTNLTDLIIDRAELESIDVSRNLKLYALSVSNNSLTDIDLSSNTELGVFECNVNGLKNIDLSKNTKLLFLYCTHNDLNTINLRNNKILQRVFCNNNQISTLDVSQNPDLRILSVIRNNIDRLDLSQNPALEQLYSENNQLATLDVSRNTKLWDLRCTNNRLTGVIDVRNNQSLKYLYLNDNPQLKEIRVWQGFDVKNAEYKKDATATYIFP